MKTNHSTIDCILRYLSFWLACVAIILLPGLSEAEEVEWRQLEGAYIEGLAEPGKSYYFHKYSNDQDADIEYIAGDLPIIISVPHGGDKTPRDIPTRRGGAFSGVTTATDIYTVPLAYQLRNEIYKQTGGYPHIIICRLDRSKVDMNRDREPKWSENSRVLTAWEDFHGFIDLAKQAAIDQTAANNEPSSGFGFYIDLHGQPGSRTMIGNSISGYHLNKSDDHINAMVADSSLDDVFSRFNHTGKPFADMVRGENSFGGLIEEHGVPLAGDNLLCVPSPSKPEPGGTFYSGHYNLNRHTHLLENFQHSFPQISGIQLECSTEVRKYHREAFSTAVSATLIDFFDIHYNTDLTNIGQSQARLGIPAAIEASNGVFGNRIIVEWAPVSNARHYQVYKSNSADGNYVAVGSTIAGSTTSYTDSGLSEGDTFYYKVRAFNDAMQSGLSKHRKGSTSGAIIREVILLKDDFEESNWNENWDGEWVQSTQAAHSGSFSVKANLHSDGSFTTADLDTSSANSVTIDFWIRKQYTDTGDDILLYYFDGSQYVFITDLDTIGADDEWLHYVHVTTDSNFFNRNFKIRLNAHSLTGSRWYGYEKVFLDDITVTTTEN
ncbi:MAG: fibronectin type III domain-containing protein [Gammaproteobacteria bacterium]|nr:fibronectin type III domain-containing protein [Gammaproteobacteria bacterium]